MKAPPNVVYAQLKFMWASGAREDSLNFLRQFSGSIARDLQLETGEHPQRAAVSKYKLDELSRLLARCYFKQGEWQVELKDDWGSVSSIAFAVICWYLSSSQRNVKDILHSYFLATHYDPTWYKAWHTWALANFEVIGYLDNQTESRTVDIHGNGLAAHIVQAVQGGSVTPADSF
jgi:FKBP12-rapamycin complex-associated protein